MRVGFIGIGAIGWPMAATLVEAGHEVTAFDIDAARLARFTDQYGCRSTSGLGEVADNAFVITMLPTGDDVRRALIEQENAAFIKASRRGTIVIDMGSSNPASTRTLGAELKDRGIALLDAPISKRAAVFTDSGLPKAGKSAIPMVIMLGGDDKAAVARAKPLLATIGDTLFETGGLGSGHALKALNNYVSAATQVALAEALLAGERYGLDPKAMIDVINVSTGRSFVSEILYSKHLADAAFKTGFTVGLLAKDVRIAADLIQKNKLDAPMARLTCERWALARDRLGAETDLTDVMAAWNNDLP
jgi:3-hydroxyisobutyrate dehydrogenase